MPTMCGLHCLFDAESHWYLKIVFSSIFDEPYPCSLVSLGLKQSHGGAKVVISRNLCFL